MTPIDFIAIGFIGCVLIAVVLYDEWRHPVSNWTIGSFDISVSPNIARGPQPRRPDPTVTQ